MRIENNILIAECTAYDFKVALERKKVRDWLKSISAFANSYGGSLYFGVQNDGELVGLTDIQSDADFISEKIKSHLDAVPRFQMIPHELEDGRQFLEVSVEAGSLCPYYLFLDGSRMAYIRVGSESVPADAHQLQELVIRGTGHSWDAHVSDIKRSDKTFILFSETFLKRTGQPFDEKYLTSFGLVSLDGYLTNAGLLYADECPIYQSRVFCTRWNGIQKGNAINDAEFQGNILKLLQNSLEFIKANTAKRWYKLPTYRLCFPEYSERAITEIIVNHLVHRKYTIIGGELHIDIYDDRIEFVTPGGMVDGSLIQNLNLNEVSSIRRNPVIADALSHLDLMEKRGSGLGNILTFTAQLLAYTDEKKPSFRSSHSMFYTFVPNVNYGVSENAFEKFVNARRIRDNEKYPVNDEKYPVNNEKYPVNDEKYPVNNEKYPVKPLNKTAQRIIDAMMDDPTITRATLSDKVGVGPDAVKKHIADLRKRGIITREGSDKKGLWVILIKK